MAQAVRQGPFQPKGITEFDPARPKPLEAVGGEAAGDRFGGDLIERLGGADPAPVVIIIDGQNLVDILADLGARVDTLESA